MLFFFFFNCVQSVEQLKVSWSVSEVMDWHLFYGGIVTEMKEKFLLILRYLWPDFQHNNVWSVAELVLWRDKYWQLCGINNSESYIGGSL